MVLRIVTHPPKLAQPLDRRRLVLDARRGERAHGRVELVLCVLEVLAGLPGVRLCARAPLDIAEPVADTVDDDRLDDPGGDREPTGAVAGRRAAVERVAAPVLGLG